MTQLQVDLTTPSVSPTSSAPSTPPSSPTDLSPPATISSEGADASLSPDQNKLRAAVDALNAAVAVVKDASGAVGDAHLSHLVTALNELAVAVGEVTDATASVSEAAAAFLISFPRPDSGRVSSLFRTTGPWRAGSLYTVVPADFLDAVPDNNGKPNDKWFAITSGKYVGLTKNAALSLNAVIGVSNALSTSFTSQAEALRHFNDALEGDAVFLIR
ncbi:hypothetical protein DFH06DRAFT_1320559 [Mycena polygramma]|nr:hypothetical protein DFH06DRAFT_1320559 [Mycena polygramma]